MAVKRTNRFGALLDRFIVSRQLSLHQAGRLLGQHHTVLSSVIRGIDMLSRKNLEKLTVRVVKQAKALDLTPREAEDLAIDLQIAWLEDLALPSMVERIAVVRRRQKAAPTANDPRAQALAALDAASAASPRLAQWVVASASLVAQIPDHGRIYRRQGAETHGKTRG